MGKERNYLSDRVKVQTIKRQKFLCNSCKKQIIGFIANIHHINHNPFDNLLKNLEALCWDCHYIKTRQSKSDKLKQFHLRKFIKK